MNKVLSLLMAFVFLNATVWAFPPNYAGNGANANLSGTYSGVLVPSGASATAGIAGALSLGIFALGIPNTTSGTVFVQGAGVLFSSGAGFNLTIAGVLDPTTAKLSAIIEGVSNFTISEVVPGTPASPGVPAGPSTILTLSETAEGALTATVEAPNDSHVQVTGPGTAGAIQINGKGDIQTFLDVGADGTPDINATVTFTVTGFQQTTTFSTPTLMLTTPSG